MTPEDRMMLPTEGRLPLEPENRLTLHTVQTGDSLMLQPEHRLTQQPEDRMMLPSEDRLALEPENRLTLHTVQTGDSLMLQPENRLTQQPGDSLTLQPENRQTLHPKNRLTLQPENRLTHQPEDRLNIQPENRQTLHPKNRLTLQPENRLTQQPEVILTQQPEDRLTLQAENRQTLQPLFEGSACHEEETPSSPSVAFPSSADSKLYQCGLCRVSFDTCAELSSHIHQHSLTKPFQCGHCKASYNFSRGLRAHVRTHLLEVQDSSCDSNVNVSPLKKSLDAHHVSWQRNGNTDSEGSDGELDQESDGESKGSAAGEIQSLVSAEDRTTECHVKTEKQIMLEIKKEVASESDDDAVSLAETINEELSLNRETDSCGNQHSSTNANSQWLADRTAMHGDPNKPFPCEICGACFKVERYVGDHKRVVHKIYASLEKQATHNKAVSVAEIVNEELSVNGTLLHMKKPSTTNTNSQLLTKKAIVHDDPSKPFHCEICGAGFKVKRYVSDHKRVVHKIHSNKEKFAEKQVTSALKMDDDSEDDDHAVSITNTETVNGERSICEKGTESYRGKSSTAIANSQLLTDKSEMPRDPSKPFHCEICGAGFKVARYVGDHMRNFHKVFSSKKKSTTHNSEKEVTLESGISSTTNKNSQRDNINLKMEKLRTNKQVAELASPELPENYVEEERMCADGTVQVADVGTVPLHINPITSGSFSTDSERSVTIRSTNTISPTKPTGPYACPECGDILKSKRYLKYHISAVHVEFDKSLRPFPCPVCPSRFKSGHHRAHHVQTVHEGQRPFSCPQCLATFTNRHQLNLHAQKRHSGPNKNSDTNTSGASSHTGKKPTARNHFSDSADGAKINDGGGPFKCEVCAKLMLTRSSLNAHTAQVHGGERPFQCPLCPSRFKAKSRVTIHVNYVHKNLRPHHCQHCERQFKCKRTLRMHTVKRHAETLGAEETQKKILCHICGAAFHSSAHLGHHLASHEGRRPHECAVCGNTYRKRETLVTHMRKHTGEKPYACEFCGERFSRHNVFTYHRNRHLDTPPITCRICGRGFNSHPARWDHMKTHAAGGKQHACTQCHKKFYSKWALQRHTYVHNDLRPLTCSHCGKTYRSYSSLVFHLKGKHSMVGSAKKNNAYERDPYPPLLPSEGVSSSP